MDQSYVPGCAIGLHLQGLLDDPIGEGIEAAEKVCSCSRNCGQTVSLTGAVLMLVVPGDLCAATTLLMPTRL